MRNSTFGLEYRELPAGARQQRGCLELASERLSKIFCTGLWKKVDADGFPAVTKGRI
jgi:hypothetical protein